MKSKLLSKSRYLNGLQCPRLLWVASNEPEKIPEPDATTQRIFDQGHLVGELAKKLFQGGLDVPTEDFMGNIAMTKEFLRQRRTLFEAGVLSGQIYSRADILNPVNEDEWDIIEVKSSTSVKEVNPHDVSFQKLCCEDSGLKIRKCFLAYINNQYVRNGEVNPGELFIVQDISDEVTKASEGIRDRVTQMLDVVGTPTCPEMDIGSHCSDPYGCPLTECWDGLPEHNVFTLYYGGKKSHELYRSGILDIAHIPTSYKLNDKQRIQCACVVSGTPYVHKDEIRQFLGELEYPLYFLDFETFNTAVPLFDGIRPYQHVPFQFSLHIVARPGTEPQHFSYLSDGPEDPRPEFISQLRKVIGETGRIVVYNQSFEQGRLEDLGRALPEYRDWIDATCSRLVDLIRPFRDFDYYHPEQKGSASLKSVLPAVTGKSYDDLAINNGDDASLAYLSMTYGTMSEREKKELRADLEKYCGLDTQGMIWIVDRLRDII